MISLLPYLILPISLFFGVESTQEKTLFYHDMEYEDKVKSIQVVKTATDERFPVMNLGRTNALTVDFDMLEAENDYFQYTFIHCDKNWNPSKLNQTDYLKGNQFMDIENFKFSSNTYVQYTHYSFTFPHVKMTPRLAGNYIIKVYRNFDEEDLIFTRRFMVINQKVTVSGMVNSATNVDLRFTHQEVDFTVNAEKYTMPNPFQDLHGVIVKNYSWLDAAGPIKPQFANNNVYTFNYEKENTVNGVNEHRFLDMRGLRAVTGRVRARLFDSSNNQILIIPFTDESRGGQTYLFWRDNNGKTIYANNDIPDIPVSEDYFQVAFSLRPNALIEKSDKVYVLGEFNNWRPSKEGEMKLEVDGVYRTKVVLKQGYHDYYYGVVNEKGEMSMVPVEGEHMETENDYRVLIYHRNQFLRYDELVGLAFMNSLYARKTE